MAGLEDRMPPVTPSSTVAIPVVPSSPRPEPGGVIMKPGSLALFRLTR